MGWCPYSGQIADPQFVDAVRTHRPRLIRWMCEIDRYWLAEQQLPEWSTAYRDSWRALQDAGTLLVVQLMMKDPGWSGDTPMRGCRWGRASNSAGWWRDPQLHLDFLASILDALPPMLDVAVGCWNEPEWWSAWWWQGRAAPTDAWSMLAVGPWTFPPRHQFGYSGGAACLADMRALAPDVAWTTDGVGFIPQWVDLTAADPNLSIIDVHTYGGTAVDHVSRVLRVVSEYDRQTDTPLPVLVGEGGPDATGQTVWGRTHAAVCRDAARQLAGHLGARWLGWAAHCQNAQSLTPWQYADPQCVAWWQDPEEVT